jgi:hypothetical protein
VPRAVGVEIVPIEAGTARQVDRPGPTTRLLADHAAQGEDLGHRGLRVDWENGAALPIARSTDRPDGESDDIDPPTGRAAPPRREGIEAAPPLPRSPAPADAVQHAAVRTLQVERGDARKDVGAMYQRIS